MWGQLKPGETVAIFGAGPVGVMAAKSAVLHDAGQIIVIDTLQYRLDKVKKQTGCETILWTDAPETVERIRELTAGRGADLCIDAVGFEPDRNFMDRVKATVNFEKGSIKVLDACFSAARRGGRISILGVYPVHYDNFRLGQIFDKGLMIRAGQVPVHNIIDQLLGYVEAGRVTLEDVITHRMPLTEDRKSTR